MRKRPHRDALSEGIERFRSCYTGSIIDFRGLFQGDLVSLTDVDKVIDSIAPGLEARIFTSKLKWHPPPAGFDASSNTDDRHIAVGDLAYKLFRLGGPVQDPNAASASMASAIRSSVSITARSNRALVEHYLAAGVLFSEADAETFERYIASPLPVSLRLNLGLMDGVIARISKDILRDVQPPATANLTVAAAWQPIGGDTQPPPSPLDTPPTPDRIVDINPVASSTLPHGAALLVANDAVYAANAHIRAFSGAIQRAGGGALQDVGSALAAAAACPRSDDFVVDLCAAPGSKTVAVLDLMHHHAAWARTAADALRASGRAAEADRAAPSSVSGVVVANEVAVDKAKTILPSRLRRARTPAMVVTNGDARHFPIGFAAPPGPSEGREGVAVHKPRVVVCDVPCSGDGTIRKDPSIFGTWTATAGAAARVLQGEILLRALLLGDPDGGVVLYSTCSFSPQEGEAVVADALAAAAARGVRAEVIPFVDTAPADHAADPLGDAAWRSHVYASISGSQCGCVACAAGAPGAPAPPPLGGDDRYVSAFGLTLRRGLAQWPACDALRAAGADRSAAAACHLAGTTLVEAGTGEPLAGAFAMEAPLPWLREQLRNCVRLLPHDNPSVGAPPPTAVPSSADAAALPATDGVAPSADGGADSASATTAQSPPAAAASPTLGGTGGFFCARIRLIASGDTSATTPPILCGRLQGADAFVDPTAAANAAGDGAAGAEDDVAPTPEAQVAVADAGGNPCDAASGAATAPAHAEAAERPGRLRGRGGAGRAGRGGHGRGGQRHTDRSVVIGKSLVDEFHAAFGYSTDATALDGDVRYAGGTARYAAKDCMLQFPGTLPHMVAVTDGVRRVLAGVAVVPPTASCDPDDAAKVRASAHVTLPRIIAAGLRVADCADSRATFRSDESPRVTPLILPDAVAAVAASATRRVLVLPRSIAVALIATGAPTRILRSEALQRCETEDTEQGYVTAALLQSASSDGPVAILVPVVGTACCGSPPSVGNDVVRVNCACCAAIFFGKGTAHLRCPDAVATEDVAKSFNRHMSSQGLRPASPEVALVYPLLHCISLPGAIKTAGWRAALAASCGAAASRTFFVAAPGGAEAMAATVPFLSGPDHAEWAARSR